MSDFDPTETFATIARFPGYRFGDCGTVQSQRTKGYKPTGENHYHSKLTAGQVIEIRRRAADGEPMKMIAAEFRIAYCTVQNLVAGRGWKHLNSS